MRFRQVLSVAFLAGACACCDPPASRTSGSTDVRNGDDCIYAEGFDTLPSDWACDTFEIRWCDGVDWTSSTGCTAPGCLRITPGAADTTRFWCHFKNDDPPTAVQVTVQYAQWDGAGMQIPTTGRLNRRTLASDDFNCPKYYNPCIDLPALWSDVVIWTEATCHVSTDDEDARGVYFEIEKARPSSSPGIVMYIDDLRVEFAE